MHTEPMQFTALHTHRQVCGNVDERGLDPAPRPYQNRRVPGGRWDALQTISVLHAYRLPRALEFAGALLGLSLPRFTLCRRWHRSEWAGCFAVGRSDIVGTRASRAICLLAYHHTQDSIIAAAATGRPVLRTFVAIACPRDGVPAPAGVKKVGLRKGHLFSGQPGSGSSRSRERRGLRWNRLAVGFGLGCARRCFTAQDNEIGPN
jgi:hypothetical protein